MSVPKPRPEAGGGVPQHFRVLCSGFRVSDLGFRILGFGFRV